MFGQVRQFIDNVAIVI